VTVASARVPLANTGFVLGLVLTGRLLRFGFLPAVRTESRLSPNKLRARFDVVVELVVFAGWGFVPVIVEVCVGQEAGSRFGCDVVCRPWCA